MEMQLAYGTWVYINPAQVTFPDINTTSAKIHITVPSPLNAHHQPYCPAVALRYAWEDFPECAIYNRCEPVFTRPVRAHCQERA